MVAKRRRALAFLLLFAAAPARAVFNRAVMDRIDAEPLFDAEYFSDIQSYAPPREWDRIWDGSTTAYRINAGSLDCCQLLMRQDFKFRRELPRGFSFAFRFEQAEDKDRRDVHAWLELEKSVAYGLSAFVIGEPTFQKEDADIGLGLGWKKGGWRARLSRLFVDFNFNGRGSTTQSDPREPRSDRAELSHDGDLGRWAAALELDWPMRRLVPADNRLFSYRRTVAALRWSGEHRGGETLAEYSYEYQRKSDSFNPDPASSSLESLRNVHSLRAGHERALGEKDRLEAGQSLLLRAARADRPRDSTSGAFYRRWELKPYARWRHSFHPGLIGELGAFLAFGEDRRRFPGGARPSTFEKPVEAKIGAGLDFVFGKSGRIGLYSSFDADSPGTKFWDGGNARAMFLF